MGVHHPGPVRLYQYGRGCIFLETDTGFDNGEEREGFHGDGDGWKEWKCNQKCERSGGQDECQRESYTVFFTDGILPT